jgi:hypothetical protein
MVFWVAKVIVPLVFTLAEDPRAANRRLAARFRHRAQLFDRLQILAKAGDSPLRRAVRSRHVERL